MNAVAKHQRKLALKKYVCGSMTALIGIVIGTFANAAPSCSAHSQFQAVDASVPVTELRTDSGLTALEAFKKFGITTIIRYYDKANETLACKTLLPAETDAILGAGFNIAVVFQHNNDDPETFFDPTRGKSDAERALVLAGANGQPFGSTIYFGVDGVDAALLSLRWEYVSKSNGKPMTAGRIAFLQKKDLRKHIKQYARFLIYKDKVFGQTPVGQLSEKNMLPFVRQYFEDVRAVVKAAESPDRASATYKVGAYASGYVCDFLLTNNLVDTCWLAQSTGWPGYDDFKASKKWVLLQENVTYCPGWKYARDASMKVGFDFNTVSATQPNFGQWASTRTPTGVVEPSTKCPAR